MSHDPQTLRELTGQKYIYGVQRGQTVCLKQQQRKRMEKKSHVLLAYHFRLILKVQGHHHHCLPHLIVLLLAQVLHS